MTGGGEPFPLAALLDSVGPRPLSARLASRRAILARVVELCGGRLDGQKTVVPVEWPAGTLMHFGPLVYMLAVTPRAFLVDVEGLP